MQILSQINNFLRKQPTNQNKTQSVGNIKAKAQPWLGSSQLVFQSLIWWWNLPVQPGVIFAQKSVRRQLQLL